MGLFDRITGRKADEAGPAEEPASTSSPNTDATAAPHAELFNEAVPNAAEALGALQPKPSTERWHNPYEGLSAAIDTRMARGEAVGIRLPSDLEYVFAEEASVRKRSWSENLCYYTGSGYLVGALAGGGRGALQAIKTKPEVGADSTRLRINRLLNMTGKSGRIAGNSLGVLGLFFAASESGIDHLADGQLPDALVTVVAGACSGSLYRSTRGPKTAVVAGAIGAVAASALVVARNTVFRGL